MKDAYRLSGNACLYQVDNGLALLQKCPIDYIIALNKLIGKVYYNIDTCIRRLRYLYNKAESTAETLISV